MSIIKETGVKHRRVHWDCTTICGEIVDLLIARAVSIALSGFAKRRGTLIKSAKFGLTGHTQIRSQMLYSLDELHIFSRPKLEGR